MEDFVRNRGVGNFAHVPDPDGGIWRRFGVVQQRTYVLINDDGTWRRTGYGSLEQDVLGLINS
jgi:hypothetical protein